ncbi:MAG: helix-turn-helix domain-containing GNAT family N-acetyltransferase [Gemmatimonadota bacterium]
MEHSASQEHLAAIRRFNRFYTRRIGALGQNHLGSPFSLTEVRVLYELAHREHPTARDLGRDLGLDPGYLSRILQGFRKRGLTQGMVSSTDRRQQHQSLTPAGREAFSELNRTSEVEVASLLASLDGDSQALLASAMRQIEELLDHQPPSPTPFIIRPPHAGDFGWVVQRHGAIYAREYGWDQKFEGLVADIVANFIASHDPARERCWIAERRGEKVGSIFLVRESPEVARLRLLLVEPSARGLGIGHRLVHECVEFARHAGYSKLTLWTNDVLVAARRIYEQAGFTLVNEESHHSFGKDLVSQVWDLKLK